MLSCRITLPRLRLRGDIEFIIDTGADFTTVGPQDVINGIGISPAALCDPAQWPDHGAAEGVGQGTVLLFAEDAMLAFLGPEGWATEIRQRVSLFHLSTATQTRPSLLGMDVLSKFELCVTPSQIRLEYVGD